ncbi:NAD dehydrogenase [Dichomitus squalens]|uniref:L-2-hydroxyglutarate dehydrogenase, mitochondrial n=1 Tax=Dichomitus squalens TaxID=114155 RepID=A0A4V2K891_9APHY|nr:NAD dehydrogenase [Dichomitus squalens]TBU49604.1 NAD dehydrogenase [Dichomitus squalens]TBU59138.1 NAD dehydrogenase [Dichomitus squalens]
MQVRGLRAALNSTNKYKFKSPEYAVDHLVIGGGVVGLAIAQRLGQRFPDKSTYLVERHNLPGEETSTRNSEVIHAGLYYPPGSLKTNLCLRGRTLLYDRCVRHNVPFKKTGKLVIAREQQRPYIEGLHAKARKLSWPPHSDPTQSRSPVLPTKLIGGDEARELEPDLNKNIVAALWSPETGIVDSHALMQSLEKEILDAESSEIVYSTQVVRIDISRDAPGWVVQLVTGDAADGDALLARTVINSAGLTAPRILNAILPEDERIPMYFARGSYASYHGPGIHSVSHLIYPCPHVGKDAHAFASLGTHLTLDLQGKVRFGPDIDWLAPPETDDDADFWQWHLVPDDSRLELMYNAVKEYLPGVEFEGFQPDYCGIRPKIVGPGAGFQDFVFRRDYANGQGDGQLISLLGVESPGLTSSLAIAEYVVDDIMGGGHA